MKRRIKNNLDRSLTGGNTRFISVLTDFYRFHRSRRSRPGHECTVNPLTFLKICYVFHQSCSINGQVSKFLYWQSPKMSDFLIRTDFEVNLPPVACGQWLLKNGGPDETVRVLKGKLTCFWPAIELRTMALPK